MMLREKVTDAEAKVIDIEIKRGKGEELENSVVET